MNFKHLKFEDLEIGLKFFYNGILYTKKSNRTAYINVTRFFYFSKKELINPFDYALEKKLLKKA